MNGIKSIILRHRVPLSMFLIFSSIGVVIGYIKGINYFFLFGGIGAFEMNSRILMDYFPKLRQTFRLIIQFIIACFFLLFLGIYKGVNFQFPQIFFDFYNTVITGAFIMLVISRFILPFIYGNSFCSRVCWAGLFFEMTNKKTHSKKIIKRNNVLAFGYLFFLVLLSVFIIFVWEPVQDENFRKTWIIAENTVILSVGFGLTFFVGSRAYCRLLCPFLTISSFIAPYSFFKITPLNSENCTGCKKCDTACPMLINVSEFVKNNKSINNKMCIVCERCVTDCDVNILKLTNKMIK